MRRTIEDVRRRADFILTVSEFARHEIVERLGWSPDRVRATPLAAADAFRLRSRDELAGRLAHWGLEPGGYCLFVGTIEPRKNLGRLLDAYEGLPDGLRRRWPLVVAGSSGWRSGDTHARLRECERRGWCRYLGYVAEGALPALVAGCALFLFPSLYEGFGLPPLEAMQSGVPVVTSDRASLPEVVAGAGAMVDAGDTDAWREAIRRGLEDEAWRRGATERGLARAAEFSWARCARETVAAYRAAAGE